MLKSDFPDSSSEATLGHTLVDHLAQMVQHRGLAGPATCLVEMLKPWGCVASQFLLMTEPLWSLHDRITVRHLADLVMDRDQLETLLDALESQQPEARSQ